MGSTLSSRVVSSITDGEEDIRAWAEQTHSRHPLFRQWSIDDVRYAMAQFPSLVSELERIREEASMLGRTNDLSGLDHIECSWSEYYNVVEQTELHRAQRMEELRRCMWHPSTAGQYMEKDCEALEDMRCYQSSVARGPIHELIIDDTYTSDEETDEEPDEEERGDRPQKFVQREVKPTLPPSFDPAVRSPIFFGYTARQGGDTSLRAKEAEANEIAREDEAMQWKLSEKGNLIETHFDDLASRKENREQKLHRLVETHRLARKQREMELTELERSDHLSQQRKLGMIHQHNLESQASDAAARAELENTQKANAARNSSDESSLQAMKDDLLHLKDLESNRSPAGDRLVGIFRKDLDRCIEVLDDATHALDDAKIKLDAVQDDYRSRRFKRLGPTERSVHMFAERRVEEAERSVERALQDIHHHEILLQRALRKRKREDSILPLFRAGAELESAGSFNLLCSLACVCGDSLVNKVSFLVQIFDMNRDNFLCPTELRYFLSRISVAFCMLGIFKAPLEPDEIHSIVSRAIRELDTPVGLTCYEARQWTRRNVSRNSTLASVLGVRRERGEWSSVQLLLTKPARQYEMSLLSSSDLKFHCLQSDIRFRPSLGPERKVAVHARALSMGNDDPTKQSYTKYLPKNRRSLKAEHSVPLNHGHLANVEFCQHESNHNAALKIQSLFRAKKARLIAQIVSKKKARDHLRGEAINGMKNKVKSEIERRETMTGVAKMKWDATVMKRQTELKSSGQVLSREEVILHLKSEVEAAGLDLMEPSLREMVTEKGLGEDQRGNVEFDTDSSGAQNLSYDIDLGCGLNQSADCLYSLIHGLDNAMTDLKAKNIFAEFPSKELLFRYANSWQDADGLAQDMTNHFHLGRNAINVALNLLAVAKDQSHSDWRVVKDLLPPGTALEAAFEKGAPHEDLGKQWGIAPPSVTSPQEKWTERFYAACSSPEDTAALAHSKYSEVESVCDSFLDVAKKCACVIIDELYVPTHMKTLRPSESAPADGRAMHAGRGFQGKRHKYECCGISFRVLLDDHGICDGSDENAMKMGGHEVRGSREYLSLATGASSGAGDAGQYKVPLQAIVDYGGFRVLATAKLPLLEANLVLGTADRGKTVMNQDRILDAKMTAYAKALNLARHDVKGENDIVPQVLHSSVDIRVCKEKSGDSYYLTNFWRSFPSENPTATPHLAQSPRGMSMFWRMLRPELVASHDCPLSPDANCQITAGTVDCQEHIQKNLDATKQLVGKHAKAFCKRLVKMQLSDKASAGYGLDIGAEMHSNGLNIRHLALCRNLSSVLQETQKKDEKIGANDGVRANENTEKIRRVLLAEMASRAIKNLARHFLRLAASKLKLTTGYRAFLIANILNMVSGSHEKSRSFWSQQVLPKILSIFGSIAVSDTERLGLFEATRPMVVYMLRRLISTLGIQVTNDCSARMLDAHNHDNIRFSASDVIHPGLRIKHNVRMKSFAGAMVKLYEARRVLAVKYRHHILRDAPLIYLPLSERPGLLLARNHGSMDEGFIARCTGREEFGRPGPLLFERNSKGAYFDREKGCRIETNFLQQNAAPYSLEVMAKVVGCKGTNRVAVMTNRCAIVATRMDRWAILLLEEKGTVLEFSGPSIKQDKWEHLCISSDGRKEVLFFVDANICVQVDVCSMTKQQESSRAESRTLDDFDEDSKQHMCIGSSSHSMKSTDGLQYFNGSLSEFAFYERALTPDDVWRRVSSAGLSNRVVESDRVLEAADAMFKEAIAHQLPNNIGLIKIYLVQLFEHTNDLDKERIEKDREKKHRRMVQGIIDEMIRLRSCSGLVELLRRIPSDLGGSADFVSQIYSAIVSLEPNYFRDGAGYSLQELALVPFKFSIVGPDMSDGQIAIAAQIFRCSMPENLLSQDLGWVVDLKNDALLVSLVLRCQSGQDMRVLDLTALNDLQDNDIICIAKNVMSIRTLKLSGCDKVTDAALAEVISRCKFLQELQLSRCKVAGDVCVTEMNPHLKSIGLSECSLVQEDFLLSLVNTCVQLRDVDVAGCINVTNRFLDGAGLLLKTLEKLNVAHCPNLSDEGVEAFAANANSNSLFSIDLSYCECISDKGVIGLARLQSLTCLHLTAASEISNEGLKPILSNCHNLERLYIGSLCLLTDEIFDFSNPSSLQALKEIDLSHCTKITNVGIASIADQCARLESFTASGIDLDDGAICQLVQVCNLKSIKLASCTRISDRSISEISFACQDSLVEIDLSGCVYLTDDAVEQLATRCKTLTVISLARLRRLTDRSLRTIGACPRIESIDVSGCKRITEYGVRKLTSACKSLLLLNVADCQLLSPDFIASISTGNVKINI